MKLLKWMIVLVLLTACLPVHAQYYGAPYTRTGPGVLGGWQNYFNAANAMTDSHARANSTASPDSPVVTTGGSGYVPPASGFSSFPVYMPIPRHPFKPSIRITDDEKSIYCVTGTVLSLAGRASADSYISPALDVNHRHVASDDICKVTGQYLFYWTASEAGAYNLRVVTTPADGAAPVVARSVHVVVADNAPLSFTSLPASCDADTQAPLTRATAADFKLAHSLVLVDDYGFDLANTQKTLAIPASKMPDGDYTIATVSYSPDNVRFVCMPQVIHIQHGKGPDWSADDVQASSGAK